MTAERAQTRRYIIWAQPLTRSCGTKVLYTLYERLRGQGRQSLLYCPVEHLDEYEYIDVLDKETLARDIVVYPEIVSGNPLRFQNVARFVLYFPGKLAGEAAYHPSELVYTWSSDYYDAPNLLWSTIDKALFHDENLPKTQDCYFVNKARKWKNFKELQGAVEINMNYPETRQELAQLLKTTRVLYNFDKHSALNDEALLCGANVRIITEEGLIDYQPYFPGGAIPEEHESRLLDNFIRATQNMNYTGPLQAEEPFFHHYTGIFYHAAGRCAALGAWEEALNYCRKAYLGTPLKKPDLDLSHVLKTKKNDSIGKNESTWEKAGALPAPAEGLLEHFLQHVAAGRFAEAERALLPGIAQAVLEGSRPMAAALLVPLAHCYEHAGLANEAAEAEQLALAADPAHPVAAHLNVARSQAAGKGNQALFIACRLLTPHLRPLDIQKALPGLALLGLITASQPEKLVAMAKRIPGMLEAVKAQSLTPLGSPAGLRQWREEFCSEPLGQKIAAFAE